MVETKFKDGLVTLYLDGELKHSEEKVELVTIGTIVDYDPESWEEIRKPAVYDTAYVGKDATLSGVTVSWDGQVFVDDGGKYGAILVNGGTLSGSGLCENVFGSGEYGGDYIGHNMSGAVICLTAMTADGDYFLPGTMDPEMAKGAVYLTGATFSGCKVSPSWSAGHGGAIETYGGGVLSVQNSLFAGNSAVGTSAAGGAIAMVDFCGTASISGSTFSGNAAYFGGAIQQNRGQMTLSDTLFIGNSVSGSTTEDFTTENGGGALELHQGAEALISGCTFTENSALRGGAIYNDTFYGAASDATVTGCTFSGNSAEVEGGAIYNYASMSVSDSVFAGNFAVGTDTDGSSSFGGAISNTSEGVLTVTDCTFSGNVAGFGGAVYNDGNMELKNVTLATASDTVYNGGTLAFAGVNTIGADVVNEGIIAFGISGAAAVVDDLGKFGGSGLYLLSLAQNALAAGAVFAASAGTFTGSLAVQLGETVSFDMFTIKDGVLGNDLAVAGDTVLRMKDVEGVLSVSGETLQNLVPAVSKDGSVMVWTDDAATEAGYWIEIAAGGAFDAAIRIATDGTAFDVAGRAGAFSCRAARENGAFTADSASWTAGETGPRQIESGTDGRADIFFASISENDVWTAAYVAKNTVTGETVAIAGKNRIRDTFTGSASDANILYLSDADNGDALFMDDIYSEFGKAARLNLIREVRAGAGNDVVDMTGEHYTAELAGMTVRGGAGDDVLWGASGGNSLFGDAGNDLIAGGKDDDLIAGGAGDDVLQGGGGADLFTFGENWGADVVSQMENGTVELWFLEDSTQISASDVNDDAVFTSADGKSSVTVKGMAVADLNVHYGDDKSERFAQLSAAGAFLGSTSEAVFETEAARANGILASL